MRQIQCEECGASTPDYDIINYGSMDGGYRQLCSRCVNADVAERTGCKDFEHIRFQPVRMTDAAGQAHDFHFRVRLFGTGVALDALELRNGCSAGYQFQVIGDPADDVFALLGRLIEKMRRALAIRHLDDDVSGPQIADHQLVRGRIDCDLDEADRTPCLVIDGREISWMEFGRMLMAFEGWQFKLEIRDMSEEV
jgi:hypothetical protein